MSDKKKTLVALAKEPTVQESVTKVFDLMGGVTNMIDHISFGGQGRPSGPKTRRNQLYSRCGRAGDS